MSRVGHAAPLTGQDDVQTLGGNVPLRLAVLRLTVPFSLLGWPVLTLPCPAPDGLSVGVQLVGRPGNDARLLGLGRSLEARRAVNTNAENSYGFRLIFLYTGACRQRSK